MKIKKSNKIRVSFLFTIIISVLFAGCGLLPKEEQTLAPPLVVPKKQEYKLYKVVKAPIENKFSSSGTLVSASQSSLYFKDSSKRVKHINVKVGDMVKKGDVMVETEIGNIDTQVKIQEYNVQINEIDNNEVKNNPKVSAGDIEKSRLRLLIEQTKLEELRNQQQAALLTSPIDGQVVFVENIKDGEIVDPYKIIVTIGNPAKLMVYCADKDALTINLGTKAKISVNAHTVGGVITSTPQSSQLSKNESAKNGINITLDDTPDGTKIGDNANIEIVLQSKASVMVIPIAGLRTFSNNNTVEVWDGTSKKELTVQTGIKTTTQVEIVSGVNVGDQIILN